MYTAYANCVSVTSHTISEPISCKDEWQVKSDEQYAFAVQGHLNYIRLYGNNIWLFPASCLAWTFDIWCGFYAADAAAKGGVGGSSIGAIRLFH